MSNNPLNLTRNQLSEFLPNQRAVRAFEQLLKQVGNLLPSDVVTLNRLIEETTLEAATGNARAQEALDLLSAISRALDILAQAPIPSLGSLAELNKDNIDYLGFNQAIAHAVAPAQLAWNSADGCLDIGMGYDGVVQQVGLETYYRIKASAAITNGQVVVFTGSVGASGVLTGAPAPIGLASGLTVMGVATMDIAHNGFGYITSFGLVRGIDTSGSSVGETWVDGDTLYYNPAYVGSLTNVQPAAPNDKVIVAAVVNANGGGSGSLFVRVNFLPHLKDLSDVHVPSPTGGSLLQWNSTNGRWEAFSGGATGTFKSGDLIQKTITVTNGLITSIV